MLLTDPRSYLQSHGADWCYLTYRDGGDEYHELPLSLTDAVHHLAFAAEHPREVTIYIREGRHRGQLPLELVQRLVDTAKEEPAG